MVVTYDDCAVRVAEDNLGSHINQFVREEKPAFEHLLMNQHATLALRCHHEHHRKKVRSETRPWGIGNGEDGTVEERLYFVTFLLGDEDVVTPLLKFYPETSETLGNDAEVVV